MAKDQKRRLPFEFWWILVVIILTIPAVLKSQNFKDFLLIRNFETLLGEEATVDASLAEVFGIDPQGFVCLVMGWGYGPVVEYESNFSDLEKSGLSAADVSDVRPWTFSFTGDPIDSYIVRVTPKGKTHYIRKIRTWGKISLIKKSSHGCFSGDRTIRVYRKPENKKSYALQFAFK